MNNKRNYQAPAAEALYLAPGSDVLILSAPKFVPDWEEEW